MPTIEDNQYNRKYLTFALISGYMTQQMIANTAVMPTKTSDPIHSLRRAFIHLSYLYIDLREAIRLGKWSSDHQTLEILASTLHCHRDEKQKSETIDILSQLLIDGNLKGTNQVCIHACTYM